MSVPKRLSAIPPVAAASAAKAPSGSATNSARGGAGATKLSKAQQQAAILAQQIQAQEAAAKAEEEAAKAAAGKEEQFYFEEVDVGDDNDDPSTYAEVPVDDGAVDDEDDGTDIGAAADADNEDGGNGDDYAALVTSLKQTHTTFPSINKRPGSNGMDYSSSSSAASPSSSSASSSASSSSSTPADVWLLRKLKVWKLIKTAEMFAAEWEDLREAGQLPTSAQIGIVPAESLANRAYTNDAKILALERELNSTGNIALQARDSWEKLKRERDFHRMHHQRVLQEKEILLRDLKRLKVHYESFEPSIQNIKNKYENVMKEKMMIRLERDRMKTKVEALENQIKNMEAAAGIGSEAKDDSASSSSSSSSTLKKEDSKKLSTIRKIGSHPKDSPWPIVSPPAAAAATSSGTAAGAQVYEATPVSRYQLRKTFKGHQAAISGMALHPTKPILCTVSDDQTWKLWSIPKGDLIMSGEGHKDWISSCDFHIGGSLLATSSGDGTVKLWDFGATSCIATYGGEHTQAIWDVAFHPSNPDFFATSSMDHLAKIWDINSGRCRQTFRGHVDSINSICWQPYSSSSSTLLTASGDKTISLWDSRTGLCVQTFYGHQNSVNQAGFNKEGDCILSCDADGVVKSWDVRLVGERACFRSGGGQAVNEARFDRSGLVAALASDDGTIKMFSTQDGRHLIDLEGHEDAVQAVLFDPQGQFLISASSDHTFRIWS